MSCPKCHNTGLLPFVNKESKTIPHTFLFCECREEGHEHSPNPRPSDFDFPMSYSVYRSLCQQHGWPDPGSDYPLEPAEPQEQVIVHRHSNMSKQDNDLLQQTALKVDHLGKKLAERRKPRGQY